jgi:hypothetical protein
MVEGTFPDGATDPCGSNAYIVCPEDVSASCIRRLRPDAQFPAFYSVELLTRGGKNGCGIDRSSRPTVLVDQFSVL